MNLIVPDEGKGGRGRMNYVKLIGPGESGFRGGFKQSTAPERARLEEWCRAYCEDSSSIKQ